jgi:molecular chaperone GrpE
MNEKEKSGPRKVKVTDRRRVSADEESTEHRVAEGAAGEPSGEGGSGSPASDASERAVGALREEPTSGASGGSETSEASRRSVAPPTTEEPSAPAAPPASDESSAPSGETGRDEIAELREHLQRMAADFDNYRKRVLKEQTRAVEMAAEPLIRRLLEVLDEFDLALIAAEQKPDFDKFLHGVELVYAKLLETLHGQGLEKIEAEGKPFDPSLHEALMQSGDADGDPFVADVLRPGYTLRGRVIRPAGVKVVRK